MNEDNNKVDLAHVCCKLKFQHYIQILKISAKSGLSVEL